MKKFFKKSLILLLIFIMLFSLFSCGKKEITEDGSYYSKEEVTEYLLKYNKLPSNFITKDEAKALGWEGGNVDKFKKGAAIGGDKYNNQEKALPILQGRQYYVCDIDTKGADERGTKRLIYSNDGLIYYTPDFYKTFEHIAGEETKDPEPEINGVTVSEDGIYYSKDEVALYIYTYGKLPSNFITKKAAKELGWEGGNVSKYKEGAVIGGDKFGNNEGLLPKKSGRTYTECDIDTLGKKSRGSKRIVFSNDGLIYYTEDHYATFELLYGEEK